MANSKLNTYDQKNAEYHAKSLMTEILNAYKELRSVNIKIFAPYAAVKDLKQQAEALRKKISSLCHALESVKSTIIHALRAMERNARKLESQALNDPAAVQELRRAARAAWNEVNRLGQLIKEIEEVLRQAEENTSESDELLVKALSKHDTLRFNERDPRPPYQDNILTGFDATRGILSLDHDNHALSSLTKNQEPPLLGSADSSDLETTLKKIPDPSNGNVEIHGNPSSGGLYADDFNTGRVNLKYDTYDPIASPIANGAQGSHMMDQANFDGSYRAYGSGGVTTTFKPSVFGDW